MRGLVVVTVLASTLGIGLAPASAGSDRQTRVRMLDMAPLTLRGVGFARDERVSLKVSLGEQTTARKLRANDAGVFTTTFRELRYGRCGGSLAVKAVGSHGSRVSWEIVPLECPDRADS
jgi:hypothetical protein